MYPPSLKGEWHLSEKFLKFWREWRNLRENFSTSEDNLRRLRLLYGPSETSAWPKPNILMWFRLFTNLPRIWTRTKTKKKR